MGLLALTLGEGVSYVRMTRRVKDTAASVGLSSRTLRYYDTIGLVRPPRTPTGHRRYGPDEEGRLRLVRRAKALGFSLDEIRDLLAVAERDCRSKIVPEVERLLDDRIAAIDAQLAELGAFHEQLVALREHLVGISPDGAGPAAATTCEREIPSRANGPRPTSRDASRYHPLEHK